MDRMEAHQIMLEEMRSLAEAGEQALSDACAAPIVIERLGKAQVYYLVELEVRHTGGTTYQINVSIRDHNTHKLAILTEHMVYDVANAQETT